MSDRFRPALKALAGLLLGVAQASLAQSGLGPKDPGTFAPTDTARVAVGTAAPDFTLEALEGGPVTLSDYRGKKAVILVFYRGHW